MEKKYIVREIQNLLEAINEQTEVICNYQERIPQIEIDILKVNIRELYESFVQLDKVNRTSQKSTTVSHPEPISENTAEINILPEITQVLEPIAPVIPDEKKSEPYIKPVIEKKDEPEAKPVEKTTEPPAYTGGFFLGRTFSVMS